MNLLSLQKYLKPTIKLYWWRLHGDQPGNGNFGDEITKEIIETVFHRRVEWSPFEHCDIIGAGSIIEEVTENKDGNRPYLWGSGFIQEGQLTISSNDYRITGVRGHESLKRIVDPPANITLGDPGLLASFLLPKLPNKQFTLGILPHYVDQTHPFVAQFKDNASVLIIDPTWPCHTVVEEIAKCNAVLSSSLHGLIVADSLSIPNAHLKLSDKLKGGLYKFNDYYSVYSQENRYWQATPEILGGLDPTSIHQAVIDHYKVIPVNELKSIKQSIIDAFPLK